MDTQNFTPANQTSSRPNIEDAIADNEQALSDQDYGTAFMVDETPEEVFAAINNVRAWWSGEIDGSTDRLGAEFTYRYKDVHRTTQKITEFVPGKKVVWHVLDAQLTFVKDKTEWNGTDIVFEITRKDEKTEVRFRHVGLVPAFECYGGCSGAWGFYINDSLRSLITTGKGQPN
jgi:hypothetical protein